MGSVSPDIISDYGPSVSNGWPFSNAGHTLDRRVMLTVEVCPRTFLKFFVLT